VQYLLKIIMNHIFSVTIPCISLQVDSPQIEQSWGSFELFFKQLLEHYVSDSMGVPVFSQCLLLLLRMNYRAHYRIAIWSEVTTRLSILDWVLPLDKKGYKFPVETNRHVLTLYQNAIADAAFLNSNTNPLLYEIVIHHLAFYIFDLAQVWSPLWRAGRVNTLHHLICNCSLQTLTDLLQYALSAEMPSVASDANNTAIISHPWSMERRQLMLDLVELTKKHQNQDQDRTHHQSLILSRLVAFIQK